MDSVDEAVVQDPAEEDVIVLPAELIECLQKLGLGEDDSLMMHVCLETLVTTKPSATIVLQATSTIQTP
jgi:hypothetical protein